MITTDNLSKLSCLQFRDVFDQIKISDKFVQTIIKASQYSSIDYA